MVAQPGLPPRWLVPAIAQDRIEMDLPESPTRRAAIRRSFAGTRANALYTPKDDSSRPAGRAGRGGRTRCAGPACGAGRPDE